jgi:serine protease Do
MAMKRATRSRAARALPLLLAAACLPEEKPPLLASDLGGPAAVHASQSQGADTMLAAALSATFRTAAQRALPAIVHVAVEQDGAETQELLLPELYRRFFELPDEPLDAPPELTTGTGFLYDPSGLVLTSGHVVGKATFVRVRLQDGRELEATIEGVDPATDVAVLRLEGNGVPFESIELGNSERLQVGDWVLALGNPLGLDFTVTAGIVSAKGRQLAGDAGQLEAYIQTDAAINPGNSGGPLIDLGGRAVGINSAIYGGAHYVGYGFAVPIDLARRVADDLLEYGYVRRPLLGIRVSDVTAVDAEAYGLARVFGAEVNGVEAGSPADRAGLRPGDVIVRLDSDPIADATRLTTWLALRRPGDVVRLGILRAGKELSLHATLGEFPRAPEGAARRGAPERTGAEERLGFKIEPLTPDLARALGLPESEVGGLVVTAVTQYSAAARAGVRSGQRVLELEGSPVGSVEEVERIAAGLSPREAVSLRVLDPDLGETVINYRAGRWSAPTNP